MSDLYPERKLPIHIVGGTVEAWERVLAEIETESLAASAMSPSDLMRAVQDVAETAPSTNSTNVAVPTGDDAPSGTPRSGYSTAGPFCCGRCVHAYTQTPELLTCDHPTVQADELVQKTPDGKAVVLPTACCTYFRPAT